MQVVDGDHPLDALHPALHVVQRDVGRGRLEEDFDALPQETPAAGDDEEGDEHRHDRVGQGPPGEDDDERREERPDRPQQVAHHVQVGRAGVEVAVRIVPEQSQRHQVHDQPGQGHAGEEWAFDDMGRAEPLDRLEDDPGRQGRQDNAVHQRGEDLQA